MKHVIITTNLDGAGPRYLTIKEAIEAECDNMHWLRRIASKLFPRRFGVQLHVRRSGEVVVDCDISVPLVIDGTDDPRYFTHLKAWGSPEAEGWKTDPETGEKYLPLKTPRG